MPEVWSHPPIACALCACAAKSILATLKIEIITEGGPGNEGSASFFEFLLPVQL